MSRQWFWALITTPILRQPTKFQPHRAMHRRVVNVLAGEIFASSFLRRAWETDTEFREDIVGGPTIVISASQIICLRFHALLSFETIGDWIEKRGQILCF